MKALVLFVISTMLVSTSFAGSICGKASEFLVRFDQQWSCKLISGYVKDKAKYVVLESELCVSVGDDSSHSPTAVVNGHFSYRKPNEDRVKGPFSVFEIVSHKLTTMNPDWGHYTESESKLKVYIRRGDIGNPRRDVNIKLDKDYGVLSFKVVEPKFFGDKLIQHSQYGCKSVQ